VQPLTGAAQRAVPGHGGEVFQLLDPHGAPRNRRGDRQRLAPDVLRNDSP
jgi:hypothetical protein